MMQPSLLFADGALSIDDQTGIARMRAALVHTTEGIDALVLGEIDPPAMHAGALRVRVLACGVNFADTLLVTGRYQERPKPPFSPGIEICGEVIDIAQGVTGFSIGQRVAAIISFGGMAEEVVVDAKTALPLPADMDPVTAAAFPVAYGTSHLALEHRARLKPGETLLVHGAAGGVGLTAVEIGKLMGAKVIATASTKEKLAIAASKGADHLILSDADDLRDQVKALTDGRGADIVYDPVGGELFNSSLRCINFEGRIITIGFASGTVPQIPANHLLVKNVDVIGLYWGAYARKDPAVMVQSLAQLLHWYRRGKLTPHVSATYPLKDAAQALRDLKERRSTGKVVIKIAD